MATTPAARPRAPFFSSGPCAKRPGWTLDHLKDRRPRPLAPCEARQGPPEARHRPHPRGSGSAGRLPHRHRAGVRYGRRRDGPVVAARRPRRRHAGLGKLRRELGHGRHQAAQAEGRARHQGAVRRTAGPLRGRYGDPRRGLHLERHHLGRAGAERRLDRRRSRGPRRSATPPRRPSPRGSIGRSSMSSPSPGRRCWAARRRTACSSSARARPSA